MNADHSSGERMDLPGELVNLDTYTATLAHKVQSEHSESASHSAPQLNHSWDYNCSEWFFRHPRHGLVPCAVAVRDISCGEELFLHYGYDPGNCPAWYR